MNVRGISNAISYGLLRLCVLLRDLDARHLRLLWHGLRQGGWASIQKEVFPTDAVLASGVSLSNKAGGAAHGRRKHVLVIDRSLPRFDRDAGSRAAWQYIQLLRDMGFRVTVWGHDCLRREPYASLLEDMGVQVLSGWTIACGNWRRWVRKHADDLHYVLLYRPNVAMVYLDFLRTNTVAQLLYFGVDLRWLRNDRRYKVEGHALFQAEACYWLSVENALIAQADFAYFYSQVEVDMASQQVPQARARMVPLFLYKELLSPIPSLSERTGLLFIGGFAHKPNVDGILWFAEQIWPLVRQHLSDVTLRIVGEHPPAQLVGRVGVELLGAVSDEELARCYRSTRMVVAPLRYGAGIKGKVVEALFHHVPLVTTPTGAEGMPAPERVMDVCERPADFARCIHALYVDDALWNLRASGIQAYVAEYFSPESAQRILEEVLI
jgi:glycosyltransferase involved in cell wall biosynthesis